MSSRVMRDAWRMISADWRMTFQIAVVPWFFFMLFYWLMVFQIGPSLVVEDPPIAALIPLVIVSLLVFGFVYLWLIVAWHRYVLLNETPTRFLPPIRFGRMLGYFGFLLLMFLLALVPLMIMNFVFVAVLTSDVGVTPVSAKLKIMLMVFYAAGTYLFFRICLVLPSAAVGSPMTIGLSWAKTRALSSDILAITALFVVIVFLFELLEEALPTSILAELLTMGLSSAFGLYSISIMSSLYARLVQSEP